MNKLFLLLFSVFVFCGSSFSYESEFALVNKSYHRDVKRSLNLAKSIEKHFKGKEKFYITFPKKDNDIFESVFNEALSSGTIKNKPIFIYDEDIISKCGVNTEKVYNMPGYEEQQLIKMCFAKTNMARDYVTLDADAYFRRDFDKSIFYDPMSGNLRTVKMYSLSKDHHLVGTFRLLSDTMHINADPRILYINGYGIWSSDIVQSLERHMQKQGVDNLYGVLKVAAIEMQWYGMFVANVMPEKFYEMPQEYAMIITLDKVNKATNFKLWDDFNNWRRLKKVLKKIKKNDPYIIIWNSHECDKRGCDFITLEDYIHSRG